MAGLTVKAFDRNIGRDDTLLGQTKTDGNGSYSLSYTAGQLGGKPAADLVLGLYEGTRLLQNSDVILNARPVETHDFAIQSTPEPDFQRISDTVRHPPGTKIRRGDQ